MTQRVFLPLMIICMLALVGCYRQSGDDEFEQVDSQSVQSLATPTIDTSALTPIVEETEDLSAQAVETETTPDDSDVVEALPTKTELPEDSEAINAPTEDPTSVVPATNLPPVIPTATNPVFVTPEPPPGQVEQPTVVPPTATATQDIIPPTATEFGVPPDEPDECVYEVVSGDNLFRIAINNDTSVEELQQLNSLDGDAIQVGQLLRIPGCVPGASQSDAMEETEDDTTPTVRPTSTSAVGGSSVATVEPADNVPSAGQQIHVVVSGETLGAIASRYNTTIAEITELNELSNPNAISVGQEILIPASN